MSARTGRIWWSRPDIRARGPDCSASTSAKGAADARGGAVAILLTRTDAGGSFFSLCARGEERRCR